MRRHKKHPKRKPVILICLLAALFITAFAANRAVLFDSFRPADEIANTKNGWNLIWVNSDYAIPENWDIELTELSNGTYVDTRIYPSLQQMFDDMHAQGIYPVVASGYRTAEKQQALLDEKMEELQGYSHAEAKTEALKWVAAVGHSEHQTGLAVDINADGVKSYGQQVYDWLEQHAWQYGFILRYPKDKEDLTKTEYEPWHYRYVGVEDAARIHEEGVCLEEYLLTSN